MEGEISVRGIVIADSKYNEYDKRLVLLTSELGKITVFANGARRQNSRFTAVSRPFTMGRFKIRGGRSAAYTLVSAEIEESFVDIGYDLEIMCYASYACELMEFFTHEGLGAGAELNLLYLTFKALLTGTIDKRLIKAIFEIKLLDIEGVGPHVSDCVKTGKKENLHHFDPVLGGVISDSALTVSSHAIPISDGALYVLRYVMASALGKLFSFRVDDAVVQEVGRISSDFLFQITNRNFKSLDILKDISMDLC